MAKRAEAIVAHGLTKRQYEEIKLRKLSDDLEKIPGNCTGEMKDPHFAKDFADYELPMHERGHYHVAMEIRHFDPVTGRRDSNPMVQKFDKASWDHMKNSDIFKTYTSEFVHNPALEEKGAPLVTLKYTLTEEEEKAMEAQEAENVAKEDEQEVVGNSQDAEDTVKPIKPAKPAKQAKAAVKKSE